MMTVLRHSEIAKKFQFGCDVGAPDRRGDDLQASQIGLAVPSPRICHHVRDWLLGLPPDAVLFPKLAWRRTWLMVKKDLERVGIPDETPEGIADFHAAGRHTHITELLRNSASLTEARELARHSDTKQTLKYTHIGLADQARAVASIPNPCQYFGRHCLHK
jgi:hypothetical protein